MYILNNWPKKTGHECIKNVLHYLISTHCFVLCAENWHSNCGHQYRPLTVLQLKESNRKKKYIKMSVESLLERENRGPYSIHIPRV